MDDLSAIPFLDPSSMGASDDESQSPLRKTLGIMALKSLSGAVGDADESGGEVGKRSIDQGTTQPSNPTTGNAQGDSAHNMESAMTSGDFTPPGIDRGTGLPTEFPATAPKAAAYSKLQKTQEALDATRANASKPGSMLKHALLGMIPIAGSMLTASRLGDERRQRADVNTANEQYQFQAGEEERQREAATREKVAMTGLEYTRAAKAALQRLGETKAQNTLNTQEGRNAANAAGKGYDLSIGPGGHETVTPREPGDLSEVQRRSLEVQQATTELKKAQTLAIPEQVEIKKKALELANSRLQAYLQNMDFSQGMRREEQDFRETGPTTATRNAAQASGALQPQGDKLIKDIDAYASHLGPVKSRWADLWAGKGGVADPDFLNIKDRAEFYASGMTLAHSRGRVNQAVFNQFQRMYDAGKQDPENLKKAIQIGQEVLGGYKEAGEFNGIRQATPAEMRGPAKLKKQSGPAAAPPAGSVVNVIRGPNGKLVVQRPTSAP